MKKTPFFLFLTAWLSLPSYATEQVALRVGIQTSGTLDWELSVLEPSPDFKIQTIPLATAEAAKIALQTDAVDLIVSDFLWVSQTRHNGAEFTFYPYSNTAGALVVPADSNIHNIKDLAGTHIGIAGGELDKNWLMLLAVAKKDGLDLSTSIEKTFGAPPLINEQLKNHRVDAVLTQWHFAAQLEAEGYHQVLDGHDLQKSLGLSQSVPTLGYIFRESWANKHKNLLNAFFNATKQAKDHLCHDDEVWAKTVTKMTANTITLRQRYCEGRVTTWSSDTQQAAETLYSKLYLLNSKIGNSPTLTPGTFWTTN